MRILNENQKNSLRAIIALLDSGNISLENASHIMRGINVDGLSIYQIVGNKQYY